MFKKTYLSLFIASSFLLTLVAIPAKSFAAAYFDCTKYPSELFYNGLTLNLASKTKEVPYQNINFKILNWSSAADDTLLNGNTWYGCQATTSVPNVDVRGSKLIACVCNNATGPTYKYYIVGSWAGKYSYCSYSFMSKKWSCS